MLIKKYLKPVFFVGSLAISSIVMAGENESYPIVNSNTILSSDYLSSACHRVESVDINGGYYHFIVESDIGNFDFIHSPYFKSG